MTTSGEQASSATQAQTTHDPGEQDGRDDEVRARLELLYTAGKRVEATSRAVDITRRPDYYDGARLARAQRALRKYYTNLSMASTAGLILLLQCECILVPLLRTGRSRTVVDLYDRYTATVRYVRKYYETNFVEPTSEGWRYLQLVRLMHQRVHRQMNGGGGGGGGAGELAAQVAAGGETAPPVWVNQYDMALTQFAFIGLFVVAPRKCAAYGLEDGELSDIVYFWRLLSYYLGIEERFNLFVYHEDLAKQTRLLSLLLEHQQRELLGGGGKSSNDGNENDNENDNNNNTRTTRNPTGLAMARGFMLAFEGLTKEATFNVLDHWWRPVVSLSGSERLAPLDLRQGEHLKQLQFQLYFKFLFRSPRLMALMNEKYRQKFDRFIAKGERNRRKLARKYGSLVYE